MALVIALPTALNAIGLPAPVDIALGAVRWVVLGVIILGTLATIYRFAPDLNNPKW